MKPEYPNPFYQADGKQPASPQPNPTSQLDERILALDEALRHLSGLADELYGRLEVVSIRHPESSAPDGKQVPQPAESPLAYCLSGKISQVVEVNELLRKTISQLAI